MYMRQLCSAPAEEARASHASNAAANWRKLGGSGDVRRRVCPNRDADELLRIHPLPLLANKLARWRGSLIIALRHPPQEEGVAAYQDTA
jgi:hypothetical protein